MGGGVGGRVGSARAVGPLSEAGTSVENRDPHQVGENRKKGTS